MDLTDVYRLFHPNTKEHTFFLAAHGTFSKTDQILGQKVSINLGKSKSYPVFYLTKME